MDHRNNAMVSRLRRSKLRRTTTVDVNGVGSACQSECETRPCGKCIWFGALKHVVFGVSAGVFFGSGGFGCLRGIGVILILGYGGNGIMGD
ncbi:hypothetical protein BDV33DRAFT_163549 [Aspergillus novoparasiticus]|uniref:Uncharacterized protein n=1 Tax=Aspergillus novoparasiticus TaxID=986946 RepID=A0A5N6F756_9EURO|nr:hypothetical protein BDV33DRAFT_163549 [Aspergillus novoparasiticus]